MVKFYEDWNLAITGYSDGMARIDVYLPHNNPDEIAIWTTKEQVQPIANLLDKLLCELTGTKKGMHDGNIESGRSGELGTLPERGTPPTV